MASGIPSESFPPPSPDQKALPQVAATPARTTVNHTGVDAIATESDQSDQLKETSYNPATYGSSTEPIDNPPAIPSLQSGYSDQSDPPPQRMGLGFGEEDDVYDPSHYVRDPHKLVGYLVSFPKPILKDTVAADKVPSRFLIYTPPPPPIGAPSEGEKEGKVHKVQRKWQDEVRAAKSSDAKVTSWNGAKSRATKGIDWAMGQTKSSSLEFLNRIPGQKSSTDDHASDKHADDGHDEGLETHKTVGLEEMILVYPSSMSGTQEQIREEFVNSMLRSKTKAQRDAVIATGLIPVTFAIDVLATLIWPFGGLAEIDTVWAVANVRGAKTARSVTKRLNSSTSNDPVSTASASERPTQSGGLGNLTNKLSTLMGKKPGTGGNSEIDHTLRLTFVPSSRTNILAKYLASHCHERDPSLFRGAGPAPTETDVVTAIGWSPAHSGGKTKNWEDEQWELHEVKDDVKNFMHKGAREWDKWVKAYAKDPEKALKK